MVVQGRCSLKEKLRKLMYVFAKGKRPLRDVNTKKKTPLYLGCKTTNGKYKNVLLWDAKKVLWRDTKKVF